MHEMKIMNHLGDNTVTWDVDVQEQVETAQKQFEQLIHDGYFAYKSLGGGEGEMIIEFDPDAERIILAPPISGG